MYTYLPRNNKLKQNAKKLRQQMTKEECHLWFDCLAKAPLRFKRQEIIGNYIVDFYCVKAKLVIELDGGQHYETENQEYDAVRTAYLQNLGIKVLRFTNLEIWHEFSAVKEAIYHEIAELIKL